jgi:uncharacterized protein (TIGR02996 family)
MQEDGFLRDIIAHPNDPVPRLIYADWLEEQGDRRGAFLRLEVRLHELKDRPRQQRRIRAQLRQMRQQISPTWLAQLDRVPIENCTLRFRFQCPKQWEALRETADGRVRFCESCQKNVYHCGTVEEARARALRGCCVAVDSRLRRTPGDIDPPQDLIFGIMDVADPPHDTEGDSENVPDIRLHVPSEAPEEYRPTREQRRRERQTSRERRQRRRKREG